MVPGPRVPKATQKKSKSSLASMSLDEQRRLVEEKARVENMNKFVLKGRRNRNNPAYDLNRAGEVLIIKTAHYSDCLSCHVCIRDSQYKVYNVTNKIGSEA